MFQVIEKFVSIDGEGPSAGQLSAFVRFSKCNLRCSWCDTTYSWDGTSNVKEMSAEEIYAYILASGVANVTITGGEPLIQPGINLLLDLLAENKSITTRIETNGSVAISPLKKTYPSSNIQFIVDFKLGVSQMMEQMCIENLKAVDEWDTYKFVIASEADLEQAVKIVKDYELTKKCLVYFSPVTDQIAPARIVDVMKEHRLNGVRFQLQLHKYIWPKEMRGV